MAHLDHDPEAQADLLSFADLTHIAPLTSQINAAGHLQIAAVDLVDLAHQEGTALYVMDEAHLRQQLRTYLDS
ncbi:MAG: hypothetical protein LBG68_02145, partial [Coriobacteriales bacterium]|nr:hypothetical protein [Coriobacteriales bacterium]